MDLGLEIPSSPLDAVMSHEVWEEYYERLSQLIARHRTTLVFVNTRRLAERIARHLSERLGTDAVTAHHGSLSKETRLDAEARLKAGALKALVATRVARARHRYRPRGSGLPDRIAASHRHAAATRRSIRPYRIWHAKGTPLPHVAGRPDRMRSTPAIDSPRRAGRDRRP